MSYRYIYLKNIDINTIYNLFKKLICNKKIIKIVKIDKIYFLVHLSGYSLF